MNGILKQAIELYCSMLPYANDGHQPLDDKRLYTISYYLVQAEENLDVEFFKSELRKNENASLDKLNDEQFEEFANNRMCAIDEAKYIIDRISGLIFQ